MARTTLTLSIALLICTAALGLATRARVEKRVRELAATRVDLSKSQTALAAKATELDQTNQNLFAAQKEIEVRLAEVTKLGEELKAGKEMASALERTINSREERIATLEKDVAEAKGLLAAEKANKETILALRTELEDSRKALAEEKMMSGEMKIRLAALELKRTTKDTPANGTFASATLTGSVLAVNEGYNFVVLSLGDNQGVAVNAPLLVMRDGRRVATLKITAVEPRSSIADVVPGTLARGQSIQPGDRVVLAGTRGDGEKHSPVQTTPPNPATGATVPANRDVAEETVRFSPAA